MTLKELLSLIGFTVTNYPNELMAVDLSDHPIRTDAVKESVHRPAELRVRVDNSTITNFRDKDKRDIFILLRISRHAKERMESPIAIGNERK